MKLGATVRRAGRLALGGALAYAAIEPIMTLVLAPAGDEVHAGTLLRFLCLDLTLAGLLWLVLTVLTTLVLLAAGALRRPRSAAQVAAASRPGWAAWGLAALLAGAGYWLASARFTALFIQRFKEPQLIAGSLALVQLGLIGVAVLASVVLARLLARLAPRLARPAAPPAPTVPGVVAFTPWTWAGILVACGYVAASAACTATFLRHVKKPALAPLVARPLAFVQLGLIAAAVVLFLLLGKRLRAAAHRLAPRLGGWNPLGRPLAALALLALIAIPAGLLIVKALPQLRPLAPWRELFAAIVVAVGMGALGARYLDRPVFAGPRWRFIVPVYLLLAAATLLRIGADNATMGLVLSASPPSARLVTLVRVLNDFDRDDVGSLLGENDCAPFDAKINPLAYDVPDNGIDENCNGHDGPLRHAMPTGPVAEVPRELDKPWNVLLVTIDTVRYDHTTMGGYKEKKQRDTTPNLMALANRSTSFTFAQAPSAGTMASMPAILTSRFFHSGVHLGPERPHQPPKMLEDNTLIGEVFKAAGYVTGAITTHEYFNDWGMNQGMDTYDNELGAKSDPYGIKADKTTDKAQAWIAQHSSDKWFLWVHYIDPHGRYVAHPGETQYGSSEEDLYDGEIAWTDKQLGRLFDYVRRLPGADRTIIVITSDHGDGFNEHGFINHGAALNREILHIPLIFYIPDSEPQRLGAVVSNLDIFPTLAQLVHQDVSHLGLEGRSLVPELFYGKEDPDRIVFAETNYPVPQRAAVSNHYKLIYKLTNNVYELYDLTTDPWEHKNVWGKDSKGSQEMKAALDDWLDRVYYSRDVSNQAQNQRQAALLATRPTPAHPVTDVQVDASLRILGWDAAPASPAPGAALKLTLYLETQVAPTGDWRFELVLEDPATTPPRAVLRQEKVPLEGAFPTSRWRPGELVKLEYQLKLPPGTPASLRLWLRVLDSKRAPVPITGSGVDAAQNRAPLGELPLAASPT